MASELQNILTLRHSNAVAAGTTAITPSSGVNMAGYSACRFIVSWGAITASGVQSVEVHQSSDDGSSDAYTALAGTKVTVADDDDNKLTIIDIQHPGECYLKCIVNRATQNSAIDGIIAMLSMAKTQPASEHADVQGYELHDGMAEGTA